MEENLISLLLTARKLYNHTLRIVAAQNVDSALKGALVQGIHGDYLQKVSLKFRRICVRHYRFENRAGARSEELKGIKARWRSLLAALCMLICRFSDAKRVLTISVNCCHELKHSLMFEIFTVRFD